MKRILLGLVLVLGGTCYLYFFSSPEIPSPKNTQLTEQKAPPPTWDRILRNVKKLSTLKCIEALKSHLAWCEEGDNKGPRVHTSCPDPRENKADEPLWTPSYYCGKSQNPTSRPTSHTHATTWKALLKHAKKQESPIECAKVLNKRLMQCKKGAINVSLLLCPTNIPKKKWENATFCGEISCKDEGDMDLPELKQAQNLNVLKEVFYTECPCPRHMSPPWERCWNNK